jgi:acyl-CoA synthetase (AMP-forming)/AMP-acid ligase II
VIEDMEAQETATSPYAGMFRRTADRIPDTEALVFPDARLTYGELLKAGEERAIQLRQLGVGPGHRFGLLMQNCPEIVEFLLGAAFLGATAVPINTRFKPHELGHVIADSELTSVVTTGAIDGVVDFVELLYGTLDGLRASADPLALSLPRYPRLRSVATCGAGEAPGLVSIGQLSSLSGTPAASEHEPRPDDPFLIMYTSGTTANPKGCVLTSGALVLNSFAIVDRLEIPPDDVWWDPLPMFHMGGIMLMSSVFAAGGTFMSQAHFTVEQALDLIQSERPTVLYPLFPTITLDLIHHARFASSGIEDVRLVSSVAPPDVQQRIQDAFATARLFSAYGITELCGCVAFHSPQDPLEDRLQTCGFSLAGFKMRIAHPETNEPLGAGQRGELVGRGPQMFTGYYNNPEATAAVIDDQGFFHTGDLCSMDEHGVISYHGRIKDMLKVGGENVSAIEVESFLATHPSIKMAQVVGVPNDRLLEVVAAFVELAPGHGLTEEDVIAYCQGRIARFKVPRYVRFVTEWPMSATKVQKFRLREALVEELSPEAVARGTPVGGATAAG